MSRRGISLEEISEDYPIILVDTCALIGEIDGEGYNMKRNSANFFREYVDNGKGIYITPSVFKEYSNGGYSLHRKRLLDAIESNSRILQLDGGEEIWYNLLFNSFLKIRDKFRLGETDYDFLISGAVLSEARKKPIALISNDIGILRAWKYVLMVECLSPEEFGFLTRIGDETFKRVKPPKNYTKI